MLADGQHYKVKVQYGTIVCWDWIAIGQVYILVGPWIPQLHCHMLHSNCKLCFTVFTRGVHRNLVIYGLVPRNSLKNPILYYVWQKCWYFQQFHLSLSMCLYIYCITLQSCLPPRHLTYIEFHVPCCHCLAAVLSQLNHLNAEHKDAGSRGAGKGL